MTTSIIHLSDFHNVEGKHENQGMVIDALFIDLRKQIDQIGADHVFLVFSGDIAQSADDTGQYDDFKRAFDAKLTALGIPKNRRICVPGNHDLSRKKIENCLVLHEGVVSQDLGEEEFNDFSLTAPNVLTDKFASYLAFQTDFAEFGLTAEKVTGAGWDLPDEIGVYCLNTALCSSGGIQSNGAILRDKGRLKIDTRSVHAWLRTCKARWKVLAMHHPLHWLSDDARVEIATLMNKHFSLRLYGHEHEQEALHSINAGKSKLECCAPALFSHKADLLGYSIVVIDKDVGMRELIYRQWTKQQTFVSGVNFSNTDDGKIHLQSHIGSSRQQSTVQTEDQVTKYFNKMLQEALVSFSGQPTVWVQPTLKTKPEVARDEDSILPVNIPEFIAAPISTVIHALPQFGLTCLARHLVLEAWKMRGDLWLYLDVNELKPNSNSIRQGIAAQLSETGIIDGGFKCVVIDSIGPAAKDAWKTVGKIIAHFPNLPIVCMHTLDAAVIESRDSLTPELPIHFQSLYLWTLSRNRIREIVAEYNEIRPIGDENLVLARIVADLEMLNLHRTPMHCLTLLKVFEADFDESPVNRSEMIKRVLFLLFNVDSLPTYKARPDLKDCEYVLGYFCESLLKQGRYVFSRDEFLGALHKCCQERFIDLEIHVVFDVLSANNILIPRDGQFAFKFAFWIYYFAAQRMHHDKKFAEFMLCDMKYANLPEVIEFYTGIDRQRDDALKVLTRDLGRCRMEVEAKCGFPKDMDPYRFAQWTPSATTLEKMKSEIEVGVRDSNMPSEIKDRFADQTYDVARPYDQSVNILSDYSVTSLMQTLRAASKALRNSDYVEPTIKRALLEEILRCWEQLNKVLLVVLPVLASEGQAIFDGVCFVLVGNFGSTVNERVVGILSEIPANVVGWSRDDLLSQKMGPLLIDVFSKEMVQIRKHGLALLLISQRPRGWREAIHGYIASIQKNSFYLLDVYKSLRAQYRYSYVSNATLKDIKHLIEMAMIKHVTGAKEPGIKLIEKTVPKLIGAPIIPPREVQ